MKMFTDTPWMDRAACKGRDDIDFFPEPGRGRNARDAVYTNKIAYAVAVCQTCPVRTDCADFARSEGIVDGIWGGEMRQRTGRHEQRHLKLLASKKGAAA